MVRRWVVANVRLLPQKWPAPPWEVAPLGSCRFVSMDATAKPSFCYGSRLCLMAERSNARPLRKGVDKHTDGPAGGGSKCAAAASKVAGAPLGSCRFVSMDATAKPSFGYGSRLCLMAESVRASTPHTREAVPKRARI